MDDCIFCKIANHQIESTIFYEDDLVVAFDDLNPEAPVHALIVPKAHYANIGDDVPDDVLVALFSAVPKVAAAKGLTNGYRTIINTGHDGGQEVNHLHVHVLGGKRL
jgi:histidine triad (HIT) family protein